MHITDEPYGCDITETKGCRGICDMSLKDFQKVWSPHGRVCTPLFPETTVTCDSKRTDLNTG